MDSALEVIDEYHSKIRKMEHDILLKPKMKIVRYCVYLLALTAANSRPDILNDSAYPLW